MASPLIPSREATPLSSISSHSLGASMDQASNPSASGSGSGSGSGFGAFDASQDDADKFLKRVDMEKKLHALQQRLELASIKASHGWTDMSIGEIEDKLPTQPPRRRSFVPPPLETTPVSPSRVSYEPPSPSRPWQLIDVLWQPLPPPSRGPMSPLSPRKRARDDDSRPNGHGHAPSLSHGYGHGPGRVRGHGQGHRRASSAVTIAFGSPLDSSAVPPRVRKEKRSQSHSHHPPSTSTQDVDAAKALTSMLASTSLPIPHSPEPPPRQRAQSIALGGPLATPSSNARRSGSGSGNGNGTGSKSRSRSRPPPGSRTGAGDMDMDVTTPPEEERGEEDKNAAELMMFLAHSPSPMKRFNPGARAPASPTTARVLFADGEAKVGKSNLAMAPPITAQGNDSRDGFGEWLGEAKAK